MVEEGAGADVDAADDAAAMAAMLALTLRGAALWCLGLRRVAGWRGTGASVPPTSAASFAVVVSKTRWGQKSIQLSEVAR